MSWNDTLIVSVVKPLQSSLKSYHSGVYYAVHLIFRSGIWLISAQDRYSGRPQGGFLYMPRPVSPALSVL